jgi:hypothetical protein
MCTRDDHHHCQELRLILEVTENAKSSTAIVHIERDLKYIDAAFELNAPFCFLTSPSTTLVILFTAMNVWRSVAYFFTLFTSCRILSKSVLLVSMVSDIDKQKRKCLSDISDMGKSLNDHLDKIEKQTVEEMVLAEQNLQVEFHKTGTTMLFCNRYNTKFRNIIFKKFQF